MKLWKYVGKVEPFTRNGMNLYEKLNEKKFYDWVTRKSCTN